MTQEQAQAPFLPFLPRFHEAIRARRKTMTTRSRKYGEPGDIVNSPVGPLRLLRVERVPLCVVADEYWRQEGLGSPDEFIHTWNEIHPRRRYQPDDMRWLHEFEVVRQ